MADFPVFVSPRTTRGGFRNRLVVKDSFESILGDGAFVGKYTIPEVELNACQKKLDFACLLAIGTTPLKVEAKKLDGLDKSVSLRTVRPTGVASYSITPGSVKRGSIELITEAIPDAVVNKLISVFFDGVSMSETLEGQDTVSVFFDGLLDTAVTETDMSVLSVKFDDLVIKDENEGEVSISVKFDSDSISNTNEG